jgi:hypothetical protein
VGRLVPFVHGLFTALPASTIFGRGQSNPRSLQAGYFGYFNISSGYWGVGRNNLDCEGTGNGSKLAIIPVPPEVECS